MRSRSNGFFGAMFVFVPLISIPLLAVFGIPQFAPVVASPSAISSQFTDDFREAPQPEQSKSTADDLFAPLDEKSSFPAAEFDRAEMKKAWNDPFQKSAANQGAEVAQLDESDIRQSKPSHGHKYWQIPKGSMDGWKTDQQFAELRPIAETPTTAISNVDSSSVNGVPTHVMPSSTHQDSRVQLVNSERTAEGFLPGRGEVLPSASVPARSPSAAASAFARTEPRPDGMGPPTKPFRRSDQHHEAEVPLTWGSAVAELNSLGIRQFRLQPGQFPGEFHFMCFFTPKDNPRVTHRFEAEANEPLLAVEKVLEQIHDWLARR